MRAPLVILILLAPALAGCMQEEPGASSDVVEAVADTPPMDWSKNNWWAYAATVQGVGFDIALIVHESRPDSFRLGTNLSAGFFGLPWSGNVTRDLNPRIGPDEWPLFRFPLEDGKEWSYTLLGHDAKSIARASLVEIPGVGMRPGFSLDALAYGKPFAHYDYVPEVGWFTRLDLIEPTDGHTVLSARLKAFGPDWDAAYYVEETVRELRIDYPAIPQPLEVEVPSGYLQLRIGLTVETSAGIMTAQVRDAAGRVLADAQTIARGADADHATARPPGATTWTLDHHGVGTGVVHLEITGLAANGPLSSPGDTPATLDLATLLQSTRPEWPHEGQTTTALPLVGE